MTVSPTQTKPVKIAKPFNNESIEKAVVSILRSGMLVQGQFVKEFESELSNVHWLQTRHRGKFWHSRTSSWDFCNQEI